MLTHPPASGAEDAGGKSRIQCPDVLRLVIAKGLSLTAIGVAIGLLAAFGVTRVMSALLYDTSAKDAATFVAVPVMLLVVAVAACVVPAWRALRVDPIVVLRHE
ncbi:MAG TPA: FtsX-like permease family protein [Gemmatimonadaceae bacterium]|nr:FtsX-like permease family protein [Gemmatimonadaceae bacterium]